MVNDGGSTTHTDVGADSPARTWARGAVLAGWAAHGVVYVALAWLVLQMAFGSAPQQPTARGALEYVATTTPGAIGMVVLALGLLAFAGGRVLEVTALARPSVEASDKAVGFVLALLYAALAFTALSIVGLAGGGAGGAGTRQQQASAYVLSLPGGRWIVAVIAVGTAALGFYLIRQGVTTGFAHTLRTQEMSPAVRSWTMRLGRLAYAVKGAIFLLVAWFLGDAALTYDPRQAARGLDGALQETAEAAWGTPLLTIIAAGLLGYGVFCGLEARYRRIGTSATGTQ